MHMPVWLVETSTKEIIELTLLIQVGKNKQTMGANS